MAVCSAGANRHSVSWNAVSGAVGYTVASSTDQTVWTENAAAENSFVFTGLTYGATVYYRVKALGDSISYTDSDFFAVVSAVVCPMDLDGDGRVGPSDRNTLSAAWFTRSGNPRWDSRADIDADGLVGPVDRNYLSMNWLKSSASAALTYPAAKADAVFAELDDILFDVPF